METIEYDCGCIAKSRQTYLDTWEWIIETLCEKHGGTGGITKSPVRDSSSKSSNNNSTHNKGE